MLWASHVEDWLFEPKLHFILVNLCRGEQLFKQRSGLIQSFYTDRRVQVLIVVKLLSRYTNDLGVGRTRV